MIILTFDVESGGLNPKKDSLLSLGLVVGNLDTGEILFKEELYHKMPRDEYVASEEALSINGINLDDCVKYGKSREEIASIFMDSYYKHGCSLLAGHNLTYDINFVARQIFQIEPEELIANTTYRMLDSITLIRLFAGVEGMKSGASLKQTIGSLGVDMSDVKGKFHGALFDTIATFRILHKFRKLLTQEDIVKKIKGDI